MVRLRYITDPDHRERVRAAIATRRGCAVSAIPDWFELDDHDYVDILMQIREEDSPQPADQHDPRE